MTSTLKVQKRRPFSAVPDDILTNKNLSLAARGTLSYLVGRPDGWIFYVRQIQSALGITENKWSSIRKELIAEGYYSQKRLQNELGKWIWVNEVFDEPTIPPKPMDGFTEDGKSMHDESIHGKQKDITKDLHSKDFNKGFKPPPPPAIEVVVDFSSLIKPEIYEPLIKHLKFVDMNDRQEMIDDLIGFMLKESTSGRPVKNPVGILRTMVARYKEGEWVSELSHEGRNFRLKKYSEPKIPKVIPPQPNPLAKLAGELMMAKSRKRNADLNAVN